MHLFIVSYPQIKLPSSLETVGAGAFHILPFTDSSNCNMTAFENVVPWLYNRDSHRWYRQAQVIQLNYKEDKILDLNHVTNFTTATLVQAFAPNDFTHCPRCLRIFTNPQLEFHEDHCYIKCPNTDCETNSDVLMGFTKVLIRHQEQNHLLDSSLLLQTSFFVFVI